MQPSNKNSLNIADIKSQAKSALIFLGPSLLAFLVALSPAIAGLKTDTTTKFFLVLVIKWLLDQATGLLRKYLAGKPQ